MLDIEFATDKVLDLLRGLVPEHIDPTRVVADADLRHELDIDAVGLLSLVFSIEDVLRLDLSEQTDRLVAARRASDLACIACDAAARALPEMHPVANPAQSVDHHRLQRARSQRSDSEPPAPVEEVVGGARDAQAGPAP